MNLLRSLFFAVAKTLWTLALGLVFLPLLLCRRERAGRFVPRFWTQGVVRMARHICGIRVRIEGEEHLRSGAALYAMKHQSAFETLYLWQLLPAPVFVLKKELLRLPVFGQYLAGTPIIAIDRARGGRAVSSILAQAKEHLSQHRQIVVFPEGTRSTPGGKNPYKSGIFALYRETGLPVIPVALNTGLRWPKRRFTKTPGTVTFRFLSPIAPGLEKAEFMKLLETRIEMASAALLHENPHRHSCR